MTALKGRDIAAFLKTPDIRTGYILVYGPDLGLVAENASTLIARYCGDPPDPEALISLQMSEVEADPQRLAIAVRSPSLFGEAKIVRIRNAGNKLTPTLTELLDSESGGLILVEAGDLKPADSLRKLAEQRRNARALPCYADSARDVETLIRSTLTEAGIRHDADLVPFLRDMLGNDRMVTRSELEKLVLYAAESKFLSRDDVEALCGDNSAVAIDTVIDAIGTGHTARFDETLARAQGSGVDLQRVLVVALQHMSRLRAMRADMESGSTTEDVIRRATPRIHFTRTGHVEQQLRIWNDSGLAAACERLHRAIGDVRKTPLLAEPLARQALLGVCMAAARR